MVKQIYLACTFSIQNGVSHNGKTAVCVTGYCCLQICIVKTVFTVINSNFQIVICCSWSHSDIKYFRTCKKKNKTSVIIKYK